MHTNTEQLLVWTPRVLCILFALFLSLFALDVFSEGYSFGETVLALLMHLIPTLVVVIGMIIAWRWALAGAILFAIMGLFWLFSSGGESWVISGPLFTIAALFLLDWAYRGRRQSHEGNSEQPNHS